MVVQAKICKILPIISGEGRNGHYEIHPYIIEWEETDGARVFTQSAKIEFNVKSVKTGELDKIAGLPQTFTCNISIQVKEYNQRYFTEVSAGMIDSNYKIQRSY
ncbi:MAG: DUF3127 domain-containing protein [Prevotella sp.]|nr:DUF3127 domain-containing protein [Prevotella sp.]